MSFLYLMVIYLKGGPGTALRVVLRVIPLIAIIPRRGGDESSARNGIQEEGIEYIIDVGKEEAEYGID